MVDEVRSGEAYQSIDNRHPESKPKRMAAWNRRIETKNRLEVEEEDAIESAKIKTRRSPDGVLYGVWHGLGPSKGIDSRRWTDSTR